MSRYIPVNNSAYPFLLTLFVAIFLISNITSTKGVMLGPLVTDGAFFLFPVAYVIGDVISECYGFKAAKRAIWAGFMITLVAVGSFYAAIALPSADFYQGQEAFAATLGLVPRIVLASLAGYAVGQFLNAWLLTRMKDMLGTGALWKRLLSSTVLGEFGDTLIFCLIAAPVIGISTLSDTINYVVVGFVWKTLMEVAVMPITYQVIKFINSRELA
ncbi:queuosine precursor transporter [Corynebacterium felinum]|uniref:Probable queuosine precursor transporter n=1 Tax=Corynebacterium felinum TaxID=131318 RepID=A0ABU2B774_9CORY|nr:queuosine precursor transporter [Corynebacterium felinum]MDF5820384.1 queuosine precursor transporter [Corynebacterium felinum]MDR7354458.1 putative integral membrane protein (TIGR00697 family) [Corynebacterium felinum]WJY93827.1 hypothetical protein CFELI_00880 [Corynebacterium felinum]